MQTSLNELALIEEFLLSKPGNSEKVLMQARLILQPELQESTYWQRKTYELVKHYGRQKLREEISQVDQKLFSGPEYLPFRQKIMQFFTR